MQNSGVKSFVLAKELFYLEQRDRVALVGLPLSELGPKDIPHRIRVRPELAGALLRYINSLENLKSFLNSRGVFSSQCLLTLNDKIFIDC